MRLPPGSELAQMREKHAIRALGFEKLIEALLLLGFAPPKPGENRQQWAFDKLKKDAP